jgi:hypothetical protein
MGAAECGFSVSAGSRGTISNDSARGSSEEDGCLSHCSSAAVFAAPVSMLEAAGAFGVSVSGPPLMGNAPVVSSVSPALATVGSVEAAVAVSDSGAPG